MLGICGGGQPGIIGFYCDCLELFDKARSDKKNIFVETGATHYDLYGKPEYTSQTIAKLKDFYRRYL